MTACRVARSLSLHSPPDILSRAVARVQVQMSFDATCQACHQPLLIAVEDLRQTVSCPNCGTTHRVIEITDRCVITAPIQRHIGSDDDPGGGNFGNITAEGAAADTEPDAPAMEADEIRSLGAQIHGPDEALGATEVMLQSESRNRHEGEQAWRATSRFATSRAGLATHLVMVLLDVANFLRGRDANTRSHWTVGGALIVFVALKWMPALLPLVLSGCLLVGYFLFLDWLWSLQSDEGTWDAREVLRRSWSVVGVSLASAHVRRDGSGTWTGGRASQRPLGSRLPAPVAIVARLTLGFAIALILAASMQRMTNHAR